MNSNLQRFMDDCKAFFAEGKYTPVANFFLKRNGYGEIIGCCSVAFLFVKNGAVDNNYTGLIIKEYGITEPNVWNIIYGYDGNTFSDTIDNEYYKAGQQLRKELNPK